jgi:hypothetical protein
VSSRFRHEDVSSVPGGWKVRTVKAGAHRVRVAFPPGRKQVGSGRLVSILHPIAGSNPCTNPCNLRSTNPAELMVMSANNPPRRRHGHNARMDDFTKKHLKTWLRESVFSGERRHVGKIIREYVRRHPEVLAESRSWPEIQRMAESSGYNPQEISVLLKKRAARERAAQIRAAGTAGVQGHSNPRRVSWDPAIKKYLATKYLSKYGNLFGTGETKAAAIRALKENIEAAKSGRRNPDYVYFEMNGREYRTDGRIVEGKDGQTWNRTGSLPVVLKAREVWNTARQNPAELLVMGANPRIEVVSSPNPPTEDIVEEFTGREVEYLEVFNEPHMPRGRYGKLGPLIALYIKPAKGGPVQRIGAAESVGHEYPKAWIGNPPLVVTDSSAKQIYFVEGAQDITPCLELFGAIDRGGGIVELGQARRIDYQCRKEVASPDEDLWKHDHGEENGVLPTVLFDTRNKRLLYEGGDYRIEGPWIRN